VSLKYFLNEEAKQRGIEFSAPRPCDAGFDLPSLREVVIGRGMMAAIRTGIHLSIPEGCVGIVKDRSSIALRGGVTAAGVIDSGFRGEVKILMFNLGDSELRLKAGERVAQLLLLRHEGAVGCEEVQILEELGASARGQGGFGSTGK